jgi:hypothetical protein
VTSCSCLQWVLKLLDSSQSVRLVRGRFQSQGCIDGDNLARVLLGSSSAPGAGLGASDPGTLRPEALGLCIQLILPLTSSLFYPLLPTPPQHPRSENWRLVLFLHPGESASPSVV